MVTAAGLFCLKASMQGVANVKQQQAEILNGRQPEQWYIANTYSI
jgi:hypothetical protein